MLHLDTLLLFQILEKLLISAKFFFLATLKYYPRNDAVITSLMKATQVGALTACED